MTATHRTPHLQLPAPRPAPSQPADVLGLILHSPHVSPGHPFLCRGPLLVRTEGASGRGAGLVVVQRGGRSGEVLLFF